MKALKLFLLVILVSSFVSIPSSYALQAERVVSASWVECVAYAAGCYWYGEPYCKYYDMAGCNLF